MKLRSQGNIAILEYDWTPQDRMTFYWAYISDKNSDILELNTITESQLFNQVIIKCKRSRLYTLATEYILSLNV